MDEIAAGGGIPSADPTQSMPGPPGGGARESPQFNPGDVLASRFTIIRFLARGGMGEVYEASDQHLHGKHVAVKTLRPEIGHSATARQRFEREVLTAREIHHPNVCPTYDIFREPGTYGDLLFLTMKLLAGEPLSARIARVRAMAPEAALPIIRQMAAGLDAAHRAGVVHRDFKPGNVIVDSSGDELQVCITDFGLSRSNKLDSSVTSTGHISGTGGYIAPEIYGGQAPGAASDVYAFGVVMYEMLTGTRPGVNLQKITPPSSLAANLPKVWDRVILGCLEADPEQRLPSAGEAVMLLDQGGAGGPLPAPRVLPRRRVLIAGTGAIAAGAAAWLGWPKLRAVLHPLPERRFVALMAWPPGEEPETRGLLHTVLEAIESRLVGAEATARNLLVIDSADLRGQSPAREPAEASSSLGANLVLAASLQSLPEEYRLVLQVLETPGKRVLRQGALSASRNALDRFADRACALAGELLDVQTPGRAPSDQDQLARLPAAAYQPFYLAEDLMTRPNDTGIDQAIEQYQKALDADAQFGLGYAQLSRAYTRKYQLTHDLAQLSLAGRNAEKARQYGGGPGKAIFASALVSLYQGKSAEAYQSFDTALRADPANQQIAYYKARALRDQGRGKEEQAVYRDILQRRPNYWPAYNELGWTLWRENRYQEAADAFGEAAAVALHVALPCANQGSMYMLLERKTEAAEAFQRALERAPNYVAYSNLGSLAFAAGDYRKALSYYRSARDLKPREDVAWRNIADCYLVLGDASATRENYAQAASLLGEVLATNPNEGRSWMTLAFYHAKVGRRTEADADIAKAEEHKATDPQSQFLKAQALAALGRKEEALQLVLKLMDGGLSTVEVQLALDLAPVRGDQRYKNRVAEREKKKKE
jgi:eukaryotic-like serine/threonine-protein kinase